MTVSVVQSVTVVDAASGSFSSPTTAGNAVIVAVTCAQVNNVTMAVTGVTLGGAAGNFAQAAASQSGYAGGFTEFAAVWADPNCAGGQTAVAVSGTNLPLGAGSDNGFVAYEVSGLVSSSSLASVLDKTATGSGTTGTAVSSGTTAATTQAAEIAVAGLAGGATLSSFTAGYTVSAINDGSGEFNAAGYKILSATGTQSLAATQSSSLPWAGAIATFKAASGVSVSLPVAQATAAAYSPASAAGPVALPAGQVTAAAWPAAGSVAVALAAAQATAAAYVPAVGPAAVALPAGAAAAQAYPLAPGGPVTVALAAAAAAAAAYPLAVPRRLLISLAARAGTDDYGTAYPQGLQVLQGVISGSEFRGTNWLENPDGMFLYDGPPAAGNLLLSVAPLAGTDAFGNAYRAGHWAYFAGDAVGLFNQGTNPALMYVPISATATTGPQMFAFTTGTGTGTEQLWLVASSGKESSNADAAIQMISESSDGTIAPSMIFEFGGTVAVTLTAAGFTADTWHNITLDSGWSTTVTPQYRFLPDGNVQVRGQITHSGVTAATNINGSNPVPAAYRPSVTRVYRPPAAGDSAGTVAITSAGILVMRASGFTASAAFLDGIYSLLGKGEQ